MIIMIRKCSKASKDDDTITFWLQLAVNTDKTSFL